MNCFNAVSSTARAALASGTEEETGAEGGGEADPGDTGVCGRKDLSGGGIVQFDGA